MARNTFTQPDCPCHLCEKKMFSLQHHINEIVTTPSTLRFTPPTIFCPYLDMWRSMWFACCCTTPHPDKEICQQTVRNNQVVECKCPRCCKKCMQNFKIDESTHLKIDCQQCATKTYLYMPCQHLKGFCPMK